jgi:hypothetical protein
MSESDGKLFRRPEPVTTHPNRSFGGYYRSDDFQDIKGKDLRGVPLQTAEDAAVAAVRMGYQIVDGQIERGLDMARRLRGAAKRAGPLDTRDVLNLTEDLITRAIHVGIEFLESASDKPESPLRRVLTADMKLLGSLFGLSLKETKDRSGSTATADKSSPADEDESDRCEWTAPSPNSVRIRHGKGSTKRAVTVTRLNLDSREPETYDVQFHPLSHSIDESIEGSLTLAAGAPVVLELVTTNKGPSGRWRAAVCTESGDQVGIIEIEL